MTKRHFIELADFLRKPSGADKFTDSQIRHLADFCARQNPNFDRERWLGYIRGDCGPSDGKPSV